jgi:hypothetical protein
MGDEIRWEKDLRIGMVVGVAIRTSKQCLLFKHCSTEDPFDVNTFGMDHSKKNISLHVKRKV